MYKYIFLLITTLGVYACQTPSVSQPENILEKPWDEIESLAKGTTINLVMWTGDPYINAYMRGYVTEQLKEQFDISLNISSGQGNQLVSSLMTEREANKAQSEYDMMWINGETFFQLRQIEALFGPFTDKLPNAQYINFENPFIGIDFQQQIQGYEAPWGNVQLALIYDSTRVSIPPKNKEEFVTWAKNNPGKFTFDTAFTGMTFLKSLLIDIAGGKGALDGDFDEAKYNQYAPVLWEYIRSIRPYLWKEGKTFPNSVAQLHQLFANSEVAFTMSNNDGEVDNKVLQKLFPETSRAYVLDSGTIQNSHYMGIVHNAHNKAGALVVINFLISPEAQLKKMDPQVWGDGTILAMEKLPDTWQEKFEKLPTRRFAPKRSEIQDKALMEIAPEYMIRLYDDFRTQIIEQ